MAPGSLTLVGGLALGLARSLHCAAMCGPIGASLMFGFGGGGLMPCGLVYGALFYAGLAGGPLQGAGVMAGFGLMALAALSLAAPAAALAVFRRLDPP